jgi:hypothetical protein
MRRAREADRVWQQGVVTGQFNFPADELAYIDAHSILLDHQPVRGASAGSSYERQPYVLSADAMYSSGLSTGFADTQTLPQVVQINAGAQRAVSIPGLRLTTSTPRMDYAGGGAAARRRCGPRLNGWLNRKPSP